MKAKILLLALFILMLITEISFSQTTVSIRLGPTTGQDCQIFSYSPDQSVPLSTEMVAATWTYSFEFNLWRPLFRFNLTEVPLGARVLSAHLSLYGNPNPVSAQHAGANKSYIRRVTTAWDPNTVTWETQPDFSTADQALLPESISPTQDYLNIDVTRLIKGMLRERSTNFGFVIMNRIENIYRCLNFASGDCIDINKRPKLDIIYEATRTDIEPVSSGIPAEYNLSQNFPNPFNPVTTIKFDLPEPAFTSLKIFDELGREVSSLVNENLNAGSYSIQWDGSKFSSGAYFIRLESENVLITKKIMLTK